MTYDAQTGTVIYRSKMHLGLKRNFQVMPGAQRLELLCVDHIQPGGGVLRGFEVTGIANRAVTGANYPRTRYCKLPGGLMQAAAGECAGKELD